VRSFSDLSSAELQEFGALESELEQIAGGDLRIDIPRYEQIIARMREISGYPGYGEPYAKEAV